MPPIIEEKKTFYEHFAEKCLKNLIITIVNARVSCMLFRWIQTGKTKTE